MFTRNKMKEFSLTVLSLNGNFTPARKQKFDQTIKIVTQLLKSDEFREWFIDQATKKLFKQLPISQQTLTPVELYELSQRHVEFHYWIQKKPWWKRFTKTMGWTIDDDITTYQDIYDGMSLAGLIGHIGHESAHLLGFSHSFEWVPIRDSSAPYKIGNWLEAKAKSII